MPIIAESTYTPPAIFRNPHIQTIYPVFFRVVRGVNYTRERIDTPDGDFLDLDWSCVGSEHLVIVVHGLEGSSRSKYMPGIIRAFNRRGWDGLAMNQRGCGGEINRRPGFYHAGSTDDLQTVITHILRQKRYAALALVGFSMGGNIILNYLGEQGDSLAPEICKAATVSTPCDLASSAEKLADPGSFIYMQRFLFAFYRKIRRKHRLMPEKIQKKDFYKIRTFKQYDDRYTAPLHGFASAEEYWSKTSAKRCLLNIRIPTLMINAQDDPMLGPESYPIEEARANPYLFLEMPSAGGHSGFVRFTPEGEYWHETRIAEFIIEEGS
jgi:uncharacterized protein